MPPRTASDVQFFLGALCLKWFEVELHRLALRACPGSIGFHAALNDGGGPGVGPSPTGVRHDRSTPSQLQQPMTQSSGCHTIAAVACCATQDPISDSSDNM